MGKFKKGLFLGTILGAALTWLQTTPKGRETRDDLIDHAATIYRDTITALKNSATWQEMTQEGYLDLVKTKVAGYAKKYGLSEDVQRSLIMKLGQRWEEVKEKLAKMH